MNIHHLELFYYVARHGGISEAVRNMPYGIQQPAMSGQVIQLEEFLGVTLFQRRPFALTPTGEELYQFIKPFFDNLQRVADKLRGGISQHIRIGASEIVLRDHLPGVLQAMQRKFPKLKVTLREGYQPQLETWLQKQELDLAITLLEGKPPAGLNALPLFELPLVLMTHRDSKIKSAADLWKQDRIEQTLISLPINEAIYKSFQAGLARLKVDWFTGIEVSTVELVQAYVANGYGIGLSIAIPKAKPPADIRILPLDGFEPVTFGVLWPGKATPTIQAFLGTIREAASTLTGNSQANSVCDPVWKHQTPSTKHRIKAPNAKPQTPKKHQIPKPKLPKSPKLQAPKVAGALLGFWSLGFLWVLGFGVWCFRA